MKGVQAVALLRIGAEVEAADIDVAGEQAAQLNGDRTQGSQRLAHGRIDKTRPAERRVQPALPSGEDVPGDLGRKGRGPKLGFELLHCGRRAQHFARHRHHQRGHALVPAHVVAPACVAGDQPRMIGRDQRQMGEAIGVVERQAPSGGKTRAAGDVAELVVLAEDHAALPRSSPASARSIRRTTLSRP